MPPPIADVPNSTNLSFRAVRPSAVQPTPKLSKAAQKRQAVQEAARNTAAQPPPDSSTPRKKKRDEQQPQLSTSELSKGRKKAGKTKAAQPGSQASLYNFFSSPHGRKETAEEERNDTDEDEGEEHDGKNGEGGRKKETKARKRKRREDGQTLEQVEKDVRKLLFPTTDTPHAALKAGGKKAKRDDEEDERDADEEQSEDDEFVAAPTKHTALGLYSCQADYNRNVLAALREEYRDISQTRSQQAHSHSNPPAPAVSHAVRLLCLCVEAATNLEHLQCFWDQAHSRHAVSICAVYYNGSSSYRWPSEQQKKRFRVFNRIGRSHDKRPAKIIDTVDIREHGVIKCTAVTFAFALRHHEVGDSEVVSKGLKFMLPTWQDKSEREMSEADRLQLSAVVLGMMKLPIEKVMFEAKDIFLVLMSSLRSPQAPRCQQLVDVQVACWLLDPNVTKESDRSKYQLLPLVQKYLERDSGYDTDVTDRPADILRGLLVDMEDVLVLWHAVRGQLALQRMNVMMDLEMQLLPVLAEMQYLGNRFDDKHFVVANNAVSMKMTAINEQLVTLAGEPFLVTSPAAVAHIMFGQLLATNIQR